MCGIAGAIGAIDPEVTRAVRAMSDAQTHRGPDGSGFYASVGDGGGPGVVFAHRRLKIIDLSERGAQPMHDPESGNVVVFNGEIYNYAELRKDREAEGAHYRSESDTEVLLDLCGRDPAAVSRLRGMFAYALYSPARRSVVLVRDRLGIKPLYVAEAARPGGRQVLLFASEVRALLASGLLPRRLDPDGVESFVWNGFVAGPVTIAKGIRLLGPGSLLRVALDGRPLGEERWWTPPSAPGTRRDPEGLREELERAVEQHLVSDVPLGVFLSGGIDSSALAALAAKRAPGAVRTFNIGFEEAEYDEAPHARAVAKALGTEHVEVRLGEARFAEELPAALAGLDQPTFDAINTYFVSRAVREAGITVALAGTGGDELFGGYRSFVDLPRALRASRWLSAVPGAALRAAADLALRVASAGRRMPPQTRWGKLADALACRDRLLDLYQVSYALFTDRFEDALLAVPRGGRMRSGLPVARASRLEADVAALPPLAAISALELQLFIGERLLRDTDAASMAVALEARVPLLDHVVVERAAELADDVRFHPVRSKRLLRTLALQELDPKLFDRPKSGFVLPIERWCRQRLRGEVSSTLRDPALCRAAGLRPEAVARLWEGFEAGEPGLYWSRVWALFVLLDWCRRHAMSL